MRRLWRRAGTVGFWLAWPLLFVYLRRGIRTRVLILHNNEFIAVQGWFGTGFWSLPGGGIHRNESSLQGAIREVKEEIGIVLEHSQLQFLEQNTTNQQGLRITYDAYVVRLSTKPPIQARTPELNGVKWLALDSTAKLGADATTVLAYWLTHSHSFAPRARSTRGQQKPTPVAIGNQSLRSKK